MKITKQTKGQGQWKDEAGNLIPFTLLKKSEKENENIMYIVAREALRVHNSLLKLKQFIAAKVEQAKRVFHAEYKGKKTEFKGNYTFYNFDMSLKLEVKVGKPVKFDDLYITRAKSLLDDFLKEGVTAKDEAIKDMIMDAFETSRGKMDTKKILGLSRYADRIKDKRYKEAMGLIQQAIRRPDTATYYSVYVRNDKGKYDLIKLSLSDI